MSRQRQARQGARHRLCRRHQSLGTQANAFRRACTSRSKGDFGSTDRQERRLDPATHPDQAIVGAFDFKTECQRLNSFNLIGGNPINARLIERVRKLGRGEE